MPSVLTCSIAKGNSASGTGGCRCHCVQNQTRATAAAAAQRRVDGACFCFREMARRFAWLMNLTLCSMRSFFVNLLIVHVAQLFLETAAALQKSRRRDRRPRRGEHCNAPAAARENVETNILRNVCVFSNARCSTRRASEVTKSSLHCTFFRPEQHEKYIASFSI